VIFVLIIDVQNPIIMCICAYILHINILLQNDVGPLYLPFSGFWETAISCQVAI